MKRKEPVIILEYFTDTTFSPAIFSESFYFYFWDSSLCGSLRILSCLLISLVGPGYYFHRKETWRSHYVTQGAVGPAAPWSLCPFEKECGSPSASYLTETDICLAFISNGGGRLCCSLSSPLIPASSACRTHKVISWYSLSQRQPWGQELLQP